MPQFCGPPDFISQMCFWFCSGRRNPRVPPTCREPNHPKCDCVCVRGEHNEAERRVTLLLFTSSSLCRQRGDAEPNTLTLSLLSFFLPPLPFLPHLTPSLLPPSSSSSSRSLTHFPFFLSFFSSPPFCGQIFVFLRLTLSHRHHGPTH